MREIGSALARRPHHGWGDVAVQVGSQVSRKSLSAGDPPALESIRSLRLNRLLQAGGGAWPTGRWTTDNLVKTEMTVTVLHAGRNVRLRPYSGKHQRSPTVPARQPS